MVIFHYYSKITLFSRSVRAETLTESVNFHWICPSGSHIRLASLFSIVPFEATAGVIYLSDSLKRPTPVSLHTRASISHRLPFPFMYESDPSAEEFVIKRSFLHTSSILVTCFLSESTYISIKLIKCFVLLIINIHNYSCKLNC